MFTGRAYVIIKMLGIFHAKRKAGVFAAFYIYFNLIEPPTSNRGS